MMLRIRPISIKAACAWVGEHHSHHASPIGGLVALGVEESETARLVCVAILSRPVARLLQKDPRCAEISRVASDGSAKNAASMTIGAISRSALSLGYRRLVSYTLLGEAGTSYRAAGWRPTAFTRDRKEWSTPARRRAPAAQPGRKVRWEYGPDALPVDESIVAIVRDMSGRISLPSRRV